MISGLQSRSPSLVSPPTMRHPQDPIPFPRNDQPHGRSMDAGPGEPGEVLEPELVLIATRLGRLSDPALVPPGLADRVFNASAPLLPLSQNERLRLAGSRVAAGRSAHDTAGGSDRLLHWSGRGAIGVVRLSRLAMAAAIGLAFVVATPFVQRLPMVADSGAGNAAPVAFTTQSFSLAEPLLATLMHQQCCREQRVGPSGAAVGAWQDLAAMSDSSVAPILQTRDASIDDLEAELDLIIASSRSM